MSNDQEPVYLPACPFCSSQAGVYVKMPARGFVYASYGSVGQLIGYGDIQDVTTKEGKIYCNGHRCDRVRDDLILVDGRIIAGARMAKTRRKNYERSTVGR